jgi:hypothetical protein
LVYSSQCCHICRGWPRNGILAAASSLIDKYRLANYLGLRSV